MALNIIFFVSMYPVMFLIFIFLRLEYQYKNGSVLGIRLSEQQFQHPEVQELIDNLKHTMKRNGIIMMILPLITFLIQYESIQYTIWMMWMLVMFVIAFVPFGKANSKLKKWMNDRNGWENEEIRKEDMSWYGGQLYYNPNDKRTLVSKRSGTGMTTNMARPVGKILAVVVGICLLVVPVSCAFMVGEEFVPLKLSVDEKQLTAKQLGTKYQIELNQIQFVELLEELPKMSRENGTGMKDLLKGNFHVTYGEDCKVMLHPQNRKFLHVVTDKQQYFFTAETDMQTEEIYQILDAYSNRKIEKTERL